MVWTTEFRWQRHKKCCFEVSSLVFQWSERSASFHPILALFFRLRIEKLLAFRMVWLGYGWWSERANFVSGTMYGIKLSFFQMLCIARAARNWAIVKFMDWESQTVQKDVLNGVIETPGDVHHIGVSSSPFGRRQEFCCTFQWFVTALGALRVTFIGGVTVKSLRLVSLKKKSVWREKKVDKWSNSQSEVEKKGFLIPPLKIETTRVVRCKRNGIYS